MRTIICLCLLLVSLSANSNTLFFKSSYYILEFDRDGIQGEVSTDVRKNKVRSILRNTAKSQGLSLRRSF